MESITAFRKRVAQALADIERETLRYDREEYWMIRAPYEYLEYFAEKNRLFNTAVALPLARGLHNGNYRRSPVMRNGMPHRPPYYIHCLSVCKMLADLPLPLSAEERDILLAAALCHDLIEDVPFPEGGTELYTKFHLSPEVYKTVLLVSKKKNASPEEEQVFFHNIEGNRLALLIKLSDRGHNVTDLYNMSKEKLQEYIGETRAYFLPMCSYARVHYPELDMVTEILQDQLVCLIKTTEILAAQHQIRKNLLLRDLQALREENALLRERCADIRREVRL